MAIGKAVGCAQWEGTGNFVLSRVDMEGGKREMSSTQTPTIDLAKSEGKKKVCYSFMRTDHLKSLKYYNNYIYNI